MKNFYFKRFTVLIVYASLLFTFSCKLQKEQERLKATVFKMDREVMEVMGDSILIAFQIKIPTDAFPKEGIAEIEPYIKYGNSSELPLKIMRLQGEKAKGNNQVVPFKEGGTYAYIEKILYTPEMKLSNLKLNPSVRIKYDDVVQDRCFKLGSSDNQLSRGTITTSLTQQDKDDIIISNENFEPTNIDPKSYFSNDKFASEKNVIKSANEAPGRVDEKGNPTISSAVSGIMKEDKIIPQVSATGPEGYYENNNTNLDVILDPANAAAAATASNKKNASSKDGYSALGNKYKVGSKFMAGTSSTGTKSSVATKTDATYDPAKSKNIHYFGASSIGPVQVNKTAIVYYVLDSWNYRDSYDKNNPELMEITKFASNSKYKLNGILIHSFASPEGAYAQNLNLAQERTTNTYNQIKKQFKEAGVDKVYDDEFYLRTSTFEDWEGWKRGVTSSNLADKAELLAIIESGLNDEEKEARIKTKHADSYKQMKEDILPRLRRSVVSVNAYVPNKTPDEIMQAAKINIAELNENELLYYAMATTDEKERQKAYASFIKLNPNDWRGYSNLASILIRLGATKEALTNLEKADRLSPNNGIIYNNLGVVHKDLKNYEKSEFYYNKAKTFGIAENNNMGNLYARAGHYQQALAFYDTDTKSYNAGLVNTMLGNYAEANKSLDAQEREEKNATSYYLKAIIGARSADADALATNLRMAIEKEPRFRTEALADLEFRNFWKSPEFNAAIR